MRKIEAYGTRYLVEHDPIELTVKGSDKVVAYTCGKCKIVMQQGTAEYHCGTALCQECDEPAAKHRTLCDKHMADKQHAKQLEVFNKAKKIKWEDYGGECIYAEGCGDEYFLDFDNFTSWADDAVFDDPDYEFPEYAFACLPKKLKIDAQDVFEHAISDHHDGAGELVTAQQIAELQTMLDKWCEETGVVTYIEDKSQVVTLEGFFDNREADE